MAHQSGHLFVVRIAEAACHAVLGRSESLSGRQILPRVNQSDFVWNTFGKTVFGTRIIHSLTVCLLILRWGDTNAATVHAAEPAKSRLLIAYGSYKDRAKYPTVTFYEHDGDSQGNVAGAIPPVDLRSDSHPSLSHNGRLCAFTSELENQTSRILLWDLIAKQIVELPIVNDSPNSQQHAALSGDGRVLAFAAWNRPGASNRWDVLSFDIPSKSLLTPAAWNAAAIDERMPAVSADGKLIAFVTNSTEGMGNSDIVVWDRAKGAAISLSNLNSSYRDVEPSLSADGRWIAFTSDRPGGEGARDVYLYDRHTSQLVPLPGLNSISHEQMPSLSPDGRFLVFISERRVGAGERDVFLYDRFTMRLLPTPNLNSPREEIDPCVIVLSSEGG